MTRNELLNDKQKCCNYKKLQEVATSCNFTELNVLISLLNRFTDLDQLVLMTSQVGRDCGQHTKRKVFRSMTSRIVQL